jgi:hypothetical protein
MQSWDGLRLALTARGYRQITYIELTCPTDGDFRGAISPEFDSPACPCPKCTAPSPYANLGRGFTRRETIPWVRVSRALPASAKVDTADDLPHQGPRLPVYRGGDRPCDANGNEYRTPTARPRESRTQHRIVLVAFMALRGVSQQIMAVELGVRIGTARTFFWRYKTPIAQEQERLRRLPEDARRFEAEQARLELAGEVTSSIGTGEIGQPGAS